MTKQLATKQLATKQSAIEQLATGQRPTGQRPTEEDVRTEGGSQPATTGTASNWEPPALDRARLDALCDQVDGQRLDGLRALVHAAVREPRRG